MQFLKQKLRAIWLYIYTFFKSYEVLFIIFFTLLVVIIIFLNIYIIWPVVFTRPLVVKICFYIFEIWPYISNFIEWFKSVYFYVIISIGLIFVVLLSYWWYKFISNKFKHKNNTINDSNSIFLDDEPINSFEQDLLNRAQFIKTLTENVINIRNTECLVIGINGCWGSGKSSILNLFVKELEKKIKVTDTNHILVRFNPWNFSTIDQLIYMFFNEIKISIGKKDKEFEKIIGNKIEAIGEILTPLSLFPVLVAVPQYAKSVGKGIAKLARDKSLLDLKREINEYLKSNNKIIIILIDDIDRMDADSMRLLFRLIRLNADFFNTIYILAFDRNIVENVLTIEYRVTGHEYLEKIIQVSFDLPLPEIAIVEDILFKEINNFLSDELQKDSIEYSNLYTSDFKKFFKTIRDVKRYINAFRLTYPLVKEEVNLKDFIILEALRLFCPKFYKTLSENKTFFIYPCGRNKIFEKEVTEKKKQEITELILNAKTDYIYDLEEICKGLFPQILYCYHGSSCGSDNQTIWRKEKRICAEDCFDKYFLFGIPKGEISEFEFNIILKNTNNRKEFLDNLYDLKKRDLIIKFFNRLRDYINDIPEQNIFNTIGAIFDISDELDCKWNDTLISYLSFNIKSLLERIPNLIYSRFIKQKNPAFINIITSIEYIFGIYFQISSECTFQDHLNVIIKQLINTSSGLYLLIYIFSQLDPKMDEEKRWNITENDFKQIKHMLLAKINDYNKNGILENSPNLLPIIYYWTKWSDIEQPKNYVKKLISTDKGLIKFLTSCLQVSYSGGSMDYITEEKWYIKNEEIEKYTDIDTKELIEKIERIKNENINSFNEKELLAIDTFLNKIWNP